MKKNIAIFIAANVLMVGAANAAYQTDQKFIIKVDDSGPKCGLNAITKNATLGDKIEFEVIAPQKNMNPFVKISNWVKTTKSLNPNNSYLQRIAVGKERPVEMNNQHKKQDYFILTQRPHTHLGVDTEDAKLTLTVNCYTEADRNIYDQAVNKWNAMDWTGLSMYNSKYGWDFSTGTMQILTGDIVPSAKLSNDPY